MKHPRRCALLYGLLMATFGCSSGEGGGGPGNSLVVTPQALSLADCSTRPITATLNDPAGNPVPGATFMYSTTASGVATVSNGIVTGESVGTASIVVTSGQLKDTVPVTVTAGQISVIAAPDSTNLDIDGVRRITTAVTGCRGGPFNGAQFQYHPLGPLVLVTMNGDLVRADAAGAQQIEVEAFIAGDTIRAFDTITVNIYTPSHPGGTTHTTIASSFGPFGIASSGSGLIYVTILQGALVRYDTLPFAAPITREFAVGTNPTDVAFVPGQLKALVTNQGSQNLGVVDVATNTQVGSISMGDATFRVIASRVSNRGFVSLAGGKIIEINTATNAKVDSIVVDPFPNGMALGIGDLYVSSTATGRVLKLEIASGTVVDSFDVGGVPQEVVLAPDNLSLFVANETLGLQQIDLFTGTVNPAIPMPAFGMALTPDGTQLYVVGGSTLTIVDVATMTPLPAIDVGGNARRVTFASGGRTALIANEGGWVSVVE